MAKSSLSFQSLFAAAAMLVLFVLSGSAFAASSAACKLAVERYRAANSPILAIHENRGAHQDFVSVTSQIAPARVLPQFSTEVSRIETPSHILADDAVQTLTPQRGYVHLLKFEGVFKQQDAHSLAWSNEVGTVYLSIAADGSAKISAPTYANSANAWTTQSVDLGTYLPNLRGQKLELYKIVSSAFSEGEAKSAPTVSPDWGQRSLVKQIQIDRKPGPLSRLLRR